MFCLMPSQTWRGGVGRTRKNWKCDLGNETEQKKRRKGTFRGPLGNSGKWEAHVRATDLRTNLQ